jgi:hypothetical protein
MSMLLFALILNPLLCLLERNLTGIRIGHRTHKTVVVAYADDVTIFVTATQDINIITDLLLTYERATGACMNIRKSKAMAVGSWDTSLNMFDIPYFTEITILGFSLTSTVARSGSVTWSKVTGRVKTSASEVYSRDLCLTQRIKYVHAYLLSKIWHTAQISPASKENERQILTAISWYIWQGAIFRVPLSTLQRWTEEGGLNLIDVTAKCRSLYLTRFWAQGERDGSLTAALLNAWTLLSPGMNPPHIQAIPGNMAYLRTYFLEWAYMEPQRQAETHSL